MAEEITNETIQKVNIKNIALNKDLGRLVFQNSLLYLEETQKLIKELDELNYKDNLSPEEIGIIDAKKNQFVENLKRLKEFNIGQAESEQAHDNLEKQFTDFYNTISRELRTQLVFLRQQASLKSQDVQELQKQQKVALEAEKAYKSLTEKLNEELKVLKERKDAVGTAHGEVAVNVLAHHFAKQANDYTSMAGSNFYNQKKNEDNRNKKSGESWFSKIYNRFKKPKSWREIRSFFWRLLLMILAFNFSLYFLIFFLHKSGNIELATRDIFTLEYGIMKLALISLLYYGMHFASRNYNVVSNLEAVNRHRKNVAQTLEDFLATNPEEETRSQMIKQGTEAMFKHLPVGYLRRDNKEDSGEVTKFFTSIMRQEKD